MTRAPIDTLLDAARRLTAAHPLLREFAPFPDVAPWTHRPANPIPATQQIADWHADGDGPEAALHAAFSAAAPHLDWRQTYTPEEVGDHFLANYGYVELYGPNGHFTTDAHCAFLAYWNAGLDYGWHAHEAEELYIILSGAALFRAEGQGDVRLTRGTVAFHASGQPHAMRTDDSPVLAFVVWRGAGLADLPRMSEATAPPTVPVRDGDTA